MIKLIIKGNREEAIQEAEKRGIVLENSVADMPKWNESIAWTGTENRDKVIKWFGEINRNKTTDPFPIGELLFFQY